MYFPLRYGSHATPSGQTSLGVIAFLSIWFTQIIQQEFIVQELMNLNGPSVRDRDRESDRL